MKKTGSTTPGTPTKTAMTRRRFVETTAVAGGALVAAPFLGGKAPAYAQERKVHYLQWTSFVPAADVEIDRQAAGVHEGHRDQDDGREDQPERHGGADHRRDRERQRRRRDPDERQPAAAVRRRSGRPQRAHRRGGRRSSSTTGRAAPPRWTGSPGRCRCSTSAMPSSTARTCSTSSVSPPPNTWDEYLEVGQELKNNNLPVGQTLGHTFGDAPDLRLSADVELRRAGGRRVGQGGDQLRRHPQGARLHEGVLGGGLRSRRLRLGRHQQQPRLPGPDHRRDPERRQHLLRGEEHPGRLPGLRREARPFPQSGGPGRAGSTSSAAHAQHHGVLAEQGGGRRVHPLVGPGRQPRASSSP